MNRGHGTLPPTEGEEQEPAAARPPQPPKRAGMFAATGPNGYDGCIPPGNGALVAGPTAGPDL